MRKRGGFLTVLLPAGRIIGDVGKERRPKRDYQLSPINLREVHKNWLRISTPGLTEDEIERMHEILFKEEWEQDEQRKKEAAAQLMDKIARASLLNDFLDSGKNRCGKRPDKSG